MATELDLKGTGVGEKPATAPQGEGGVAGPSPTAQPEGTTAERQPVNLDDLPEFRAYKSAEQTRVAEQQRQFQTMQQQLVIAQRQAWELQQRADQAQLEARVKDLPEDEAKLVRAQHEVEQVRQEATYYQGLLQQQQARQRDQDNLRGWARYYNQEHGIPLNELNVSYGWVEFLKSVTDYAFRTGQKVPAAAAPSLGPIPQAVRVAPHGGGRVGPSTVAGRFEEVPMSEMAKWTKEDWRRWGKESGGE